MVTGSDSLRVYTSKVTLVRGEHDSEDEGSDEERDVEGRTLEEELEAGEPAPATPTKRKGSLERRQSRFEVDPWTLIWERRMAKPVYHLKFSPDGNFFAAAGKVPYMGLLCALVRMSHIHALARVPRSWTGW